MFLCATKPQRQQDFASFSRPQTARRTRFAQATQLRASAEEALREMAFVYHVTRTVKAALLENQSPAGVC
jgi:hypothetical protein